MLKEEDFSLRDVEETDLDLILRWRNQEHIRANMYTEHIITKEEHRKWFASIKENPAIYKMFLYRERPIGLIYFTNIDVKNSKCTWGFYLGENSAPKGSGSVMLFFGLKFIFEERNIRKIIGEVFSFNKASIKLHIKLGFVEEGILKSHILKDGSYQDIVLMAQFKTNWIEKKAEIRKIVFRKE